ncbi:MAG: dethiobiotin synthase [Desulfomonilaceae bacterium]
MNGIFVTGTDTGVGKSVITAGLTSLLRKRGVDCVALKPVETGCKLNHGELFPEDGHFLWRASQESISIDDVTPFRFSLPASPYRAAALQDSRLRISDIIEHIRAIEEAHDLVIVEGAGGLFAPIEEHLTFVDLTKELGFPVVLVARLKLGTINHTMLSIEALTRRNLNILSVVLSKCDRDEGPEEKYTPNDIKRMIGSIPFFQFPFLDGSVSDNPQEIGAMMEKVLGKESFLEQFTC